MKSQTNLWIKQGLSNKKLLEPKKSSALHELNATWQTSVKTDRQDHYVDKFGCVDDKLPFNRLNFSFLGLLPDTFQCASIIRNVLRLATLVDWVFLQNPLNYIKFSRPLIGSIKSIHQEEKKKRKRKK